MSRRVAVDMYVVCRKCGVLSVANARKTKECPLCGRPVRCLDAKEMQELEEFL